MPTRGDFPSEGNAGAARVRSREDAGEHGGLPGPMHGPARRDEHPDAEAVRWNPPSSSPER